jgi:hypothetical protein
MLTTPITPDYYIWGKLRGLVSFLALLIAVPILTLAMVSIYTLFTGAEAIYSYTKGSGTHVEPLALIEAPILLAMILIPFVSLCVIGGMKFSLSSKGVLAAVIKSVGLIGFGMLVFGFCGYNSMETIPLVGPVVNALSPVTSLIMIVNPWEHVGAKDDYFASNSDSGRINLMFAAVVAAIGYSALVYGFKVGMVNSFDQTVRRLSGTT